MGRVEGKVAVVSGGASGLGEASARLLAREGASVVIADIDRTNAERVAGEIGAAARAIPLDVTSEAQWSSVMADTLALWGKVDILLNSAGIVIIGSIEDLTLDQFRRVNAVNLDGTFLGCQAAFKAMRPAGTGSIINLSSVAALIGTPPNIAAYTASKGGVAALSRSIAIHSLTNGLEIRCNCLHPGSIRTPMLLNALARDVGPENVDNALVEMSKSEPIGVPDDVANIVVYLGSDESKFVNGAQFVLDKGFSVL